jgi:hypothetical protein
MKHQSPDLKTHPGIHSTGIRRTSISLIFLFLFMTTIAPFAQDSPPVPDIYSMQQAEALIAEGLAVESLKMLEKLEPEMTTPKQQIKLYLLKIRAFLALADRDSAENIVREIYKQDLTGRIQMEDLDEEIRFLFDKVRPEYWFALKAEKRDEEQFDRMVIQQYKKKPKKKRLLPNLILGAVLIGAVVAAILFIASGSKEKEDRGDVGTLKFENGNYWDVNVEICGIVKNAPGTHNNTYYFINKNFLYIDLPPGIHPLTVTSTNGYNGETKVFVYSVEIVTGRETHFVFYHL